MKHLTEALFFYNSVVFEEIGQKSQYEKEYISYALERDHQALWQVPAGY